jgi:pyruvate,water dikinase
MLQDVGAVDALKNIMKGLDTSNVEDLSIRGRKARDIILEAGIPDDLWTEIKAAYDRLCEEYGPDTDVAVRSSATAEDLPTASFAGQQETYLNVHGYPALKIACTRCFASLFTDRAISYRVTHNFDHFKVGLSIGVMKMVRSDLASSGVIFTIDTESGFKDVVFITGAYGLGENVVQGAVNPDEFYVFKPTLKAGYKPIIQKKLGSKDIK